MREKNKLVRLRTAEREEMFRAWLKGHTYAEIANEHGTYRQKPRAVVLSFKPSNEQFRVHDHFWRLRQLRSQQG